MMAVGVANLESKNMKAMPEGTLLCDLSPFARQCAPPWATRCRMQHLNLAVGAICCVSVLSNLPLYLVSVYLFILEGGGGGGGSKNV